MNQFDGLEVNTKQMWGSRSSLRPLQHVSTNYMITLIEVRIAKRIAKKTHKVITELMYRRYNRIIVLGYYFLHWTAPTFLALLESCHVQAETVADTCFIARMGGGEYSFPKSVLNQQRNVFHTIFWESSVEEKERSAVYLVYSRTVAACYQFISIGMEYVVWLAG